MIGEFSANAQLFFLLFARILALVETAPLFSSEAVPQLAKIGLSFLTCFVILPWMQTSGYPLPDNGGLYVLLLVGEALIGVIIGFFLTIVYSVFQATGQYFALQMGFGASEVFDPLAQIEIPTMGQFLNLVAMFLFLTLGGFQKAWFFGVLKSFQVMRAADLVVIREQIISLLMGGLVRLFEQSLIIAMPILSILFLVTVMTGLFSRAAPQMNLLQTGFPISIMVTFGVMLLTFPILAEGFGSVVNEGFDRIAEFLNRAGALR